MQLMQASSMVADDALGFLPPGGVHNSGSLYCLYFILIATLKTITSTFR